MLSVSLEQAKAIADKSFALGASRGVAGMTVVVLDHAASIKVANRNDMANIFGVEIARAKALSAIAFRSPTLAQNQTMGQNLTLVSAVSAALPGQFLPLGGGAPIFDASGVLIGGAAVAGSTPENDHAIVTEAIAAAGLSFAPPS